MRPITRHSTGGHGLVFGRCTNVVKRFNTSARGDRSGDQRLRYSRRGVLLGVLGLGTLVGFRSPMELLEQVSGGTGGSGSPGAGRAARTDRQERGSAGGSGNDGSSGRRQSQKEESANDAEQEAGGDPDRAGIEGPAPPKDPTMWIYVPRLGIRGHTVREGNSEQVMALGAMKLPSTAHPWQEGDNPYITAHRVGYPGRESYYQFYNLPALRKGDAVYLRDANWTLYEYRVIERFAVSPSDSWVTEPAAGKELVTLQTCTDSVARSTWWDITPKLMAAGPDTGRLIVCAEKVRTETA